MGMMISFFLIGIVFGSGPCLASCGPVVLSYLAGTRQNILGGLREYFLFSLSRILAYIILALIIFFLGKVILDRFLADYARYIFILAGLFIALSGSFIALGKAIAFKIKGGVVLGALMGFLPCGPLLAIFSYISLVSKTGPQALLQSLFFGLGTFVSPLLFLVILSGLIPRFLSDKRSIYSRIFNFICGAILIFLGVHLIRRVF
jgi:sulfite exporter TauE/SafE